MMVISLDSAAPRAALGLGREAARAIGHLPLLLVLRIDEGTPVELAPDAIAFIVTDGLLVSDRASLAGPGDVVVRDGEDWTACTATRLAIVGEAFAQAAGPWAGAIESLLIRARTRSAQPIPGGSLSERALDLLWRLAQHWGAPRNGEIVVPLPLSEAALARLTATEPPAVGSALGELERAGVAVYRPGVGWSLASTPDPDPGASPHSRTRRDALRARTARELAIARQTVADYAELSRQLNALAPRPFRSRPGVG